MLWKLAWRNIWRNKRRTIITAASILFAVLAAVSMNSIQRGVWDNMINSVVNSYFGFAQIHTKGYWDDRSIDKAFAFDANLQSLPEDSKTLKTLVPRIESFALASSETMTKGALVIGVDPTLEDELTNLTSRIQEGEYLHEDDNAVLIAKGLAKDLKLGIGDTIVFVSQGYHGINAAGKYPVKGILNFPSPELNRQMVYMPLKQAQWLYGAEGLVTSLALNIKDKNSVAPTLKAIESKVDTAIYELMDWQAMMPDLVQAKDMDTAGNQIMLAVLYLIIAFGILGTILMMTKEREYEFGVLVSIGMQRWRLAIMVWGEIVLLGIMGAIAGILASLPIVLYIHYNPIELSGEMAAAYDKFGIEPFILASLDLDIFYSQAILVVIITSVLALYPLLSIRRLKTVEAMRA
ncbi:MAG: ABC transporter permease [Aureispira sp.]|nr:ABC transporter permease [Aureispira sp.]